MLIQTHFGSEMLTPRPVFKIQNLVSFNTYEMNTATSVGMDQNINQGILWMHVGELTHILQEMFAKLLNSMVLFRSELFQMVGVP